ncbi:unnamed protein product [Arctia plantaginis]|uniref:Uncharacterized protein n=1 Tax=Arctia plantaginis TaxID=874455 RepID=A0A8S1BHK0_ARCPL|nr:unnamed protein product [Arctia plantaginis]
MTQLPEAEEMDPPEPDMEMWSVEELRKRSKELNLLEVADLVINHEAKGASPCEKKENDRSPSKSSNSGSQITVRTSPVVVDTIPVCRQCHKKCLSKPNSPLVSQKEPPVISIKPKPEASPQNSNSNKSSASTCSANCGNRKHKNFSHLERKGAFKIRPEDAPKVAMKVIDSIEQSQRKLKSTSYELKTDSPVFNRSVRSSHTKSQLELRKDNSAMSPSPSSSSRNSPLSTSHTTCSSMVFNSSSNDLRMSNSNIANQVQCVIAQEKYLNEVKCVENITLTKSKTASSNYPSPTSARKEQITRQKAENVLNKVLGINIVTKRENVGTCLKTSSVFLEDDSIHEDDNDFKIERGLRRSPRMGISAVSKMNGDINKKTDDINANSTIDGGSDEDLELGPLMLMGLSAINPAAHLMRVEPFKRPSVTSLNNPCSRPGSLGSIKSESPVPNIAVVPPTPDYNSTNKTDDLVDESPESPDVPDDLPYVTLKRYGTMSSLERLPSDETDDGNVRLTAQEPESTKAYNPVSGAAGGIMGWTARAGSFVVEKMNIFSYTESVPNTSIAHKQPSFLERCLGVSDWKPAIGTEEGTPETGEGSGASGEEAWGTPSSGDLSDNLPDSEHGTLSSPTKSSSSYAGDDDTELMMDELLMAPTITGPTTLRPLLPRDVFRRRLEPLLEEECSDSDSEDNKATPTNSDDQVKSHIVTGPLVRRLAQGSAHGLDADDCCDAPHPPPSASDQEPEGGGAGAAADVGERRGGGARYELSPDRTPTNEVPSTLLLSVSKEFAEVRAAVAAGHRDSASSDSTPSTLERTTIHNPTNTTAVQHQHSPVLEQAPVQEAILQPEEPRPLTPERLSPRAEMRLALDQGTDMLADQETPWVRQGGGSDPWSFRVACQRSLLRRVASADAVTLCRAHPRRTVPHTTSRNSVYAWKVPENEKPMEMEQLAQAEARTMRSRTRSLCQNGKIMGFLRRRASSDSPRREPFLVTATRPFSPRRTTVSNNGYYKICFVNGYV